MLVRVYLLLAVIFWGWSFVCTKILLDYISPAEIIGLRLLIGIPLLYVVVRLKRVSLQFDRADWWRIGVGSGVFTAHFLIQINGIRFTSATNTGWIIAVTPLVLAVLSYFLLRETIRFRAVVGIVVATAGILLLVSRGDVASLDWLKSVGDWLILASAHTWALYTVVTRDLSRKYHPLAVTFAILVPTAVLLITYMLFTSDWGSFVRLPAEPMLALVFLAVFAMAVAQWFWQEGIAGLGATRAGFFLYLEPLATTSLAVPYLSEPFGIIQGVGGFLVLAGVYLGQTKKRLKPAA